jgi:betaine-homocysteine S-methyltransferase
MDFFNKLNNDFILCAEGYLFELERRGYLKAGPFVPEVVLDNPNAVTELHNEFLNCGSDVIVAFTYYAHRDKLKTIGRENDLENMNRTALKLAKDVAKKGNVLMAGNICNTWVYDHTNHDNTAPIVKAMYEEQVRWAKEEGADFIIAETIFYLEEARIALDVIKSFNLPAVINFAPFHEKTIEGHSWEYACKKLEEEGASVVGLNCGMGPKTMLPILKKIRETVNCPVAALPVPYNTTEDYPTFQKLKQKNGKNAFPTLLEPYLMTRDECAEFAIEAKNMGINFIGLCCGGAPHHIRSMAEALGRKVIASKYSPDMSLHAALGNDNVVKEHVKRFIRDGWNK